MGLNLADALRGPEPLPEGNFPVELTSIQLRGGTEQSPKRYIGWELTVIDGELAGRKAFLRTYLTPKALWTFGRALLALGADPEQLKQFTDISEENCVELAQQMIGQQAVAIVKQRVIDVANPARPGETMKRTMSDIDQLVAIDVSVAAALPNPSEAEEIPF